MLVMFQKFDSLVLARVGSGMLLVLLATLCCS